MAEIVKASSVEWSRTHSSSYPYREWFDGQTRILHRGTDFIALPSSVRTVLYKRAKLTFGGRATLRTKLISDNQLAIQIVFRAERAKKGKSS